jgi:hypothetical protein
MRRGLELSLGAVVRCANPHVAVLEVAACEAGRKARGASRQAGDESLVIRNSSNAKTAYQVGEEAADRIAYQIEIARAG